MLSREASTGRVHPGGALKLLSWVTGWGSVVQCEFSMPTALMFTPSSKTKQYNDKQTTRGDTEQLSSFTSFQAGSVPQVLFPCLKVPTQTRLWRLLRLFSLTAPAFQLVILCFVCFQITTPGTQWIPGACKCKVCVVFVLLGFLGELNSQAHISIQLLLSQIGRNN